MNDIYSSNDIFQTYFARAPEKTWVVESLQEKLSFNGNSTSILDAGCHDGKLMQRIVQLSHAKLPEHTTIIGVDPCADAIAEFNNINFGTKISAQGYAVTIEDYLESSQCKFDWIIASQSLYWTKDLKKIISQIAAASQNAVIVLRGKTGIYQIQKQFAELVGNKNELFYNAEDIHGALSSLGITFHREDKSTYLPLPAQTTSAYRHLLNFFMQTTDGQLSEDDTARINEFISAEFSSVLRHDVSAFWLIS